MANSAIMIEMALLMIGILHPVVVLLVAGVTVCRRACKMPVCMALSAINMNVRPHQLITYY